eukprot:5997211-Pleurochrysis_carterae.AAC.1
MLRARGEGTKRAGSERAGEARTSECNECVATRKGAKPACGRTLAVGRLGMQTRIRLNCVHTFEEKSALACDEREESKIFACECECT